MPRCFVALPLPAEVKQELTGLQAIMKTNNPTAPIKWVEADNLHLTLEFLDELTPEQIKLTQKILEEAVTNQPVFNLALADFTAFPSLGHPKILLVKLRDVEDNAWTLQRKIHGALGQHNLLYDTKPWSAHLTIGRIKNPGVKLQGLSQIFPQPLRWPVQKIILYSSQLNSFGPIYTILDEYSLKIN